MNTTADPTSDRATCSVNARSSAGTTVIRRLSFPRRNICVSHPIPVKPFMGAAAYRRALPTPFGVGCARAPAAARFTTAIDDGPKKRLRPAGAKAISPGIAAVPTSGNPDGSALAACSFDKLFSCEEGMCRRCFGLCIFWKTRVGLLFRWRLWLELLGSGWGLSLGWLICLRPVDAGISGADGFGCSCWGSS